MPSTQLKGSLKAKDGLRQGHKDSSTFMLKLFLAGVGKIPRRWFEKMWKEKRGASRRAGITIGYKTYSCSGLDADKRVCTGMISTYVGLTSRGNPTVFGILSDVQRTLHMNQSNFTLVV